MKEQEGEEHMEAKVCYKQPNDGEKLSCIL